MICHAAMNGPYRRKCSVSEGLRCCWAGLMQMRACQFDQSRTTTSDCEKVIALTDESLTGHRHEVQLGAAITGCQLVDLCISNCFHIRNNQNKNRRYNQTSRVRTAL